MRRVIVCGGRDYTNAVVMIHTLESLIEDGDIIITGGARGADEIVHRWAVCGAYGTEVYHADWKMHGLSAGPRRNQKMLDAGADLVIAFPGGRGTNHMIGIARRAGVTVISVNARDE